MKIILKYVLLLLALNAGIDLLARDNSNYPHYPEWMYRSRLEELDKRTVIKLDYNSKVQAYIDVYTVKRRKHLAGIIGKSEFYFPLFEEYLVKYDLPLELKYLAIVESALDPKAKSSSGAMGLWQFLYHTSRMFDLKIDNYQDERCDPVKSTEAACQYLSYLYRNLNDWQLALAAYNGGIGVVQKAIERSGGKTNFWELRPYLPQEVQSYVPAFIAVNYVMNNYERHDIAVDAVPVKFDEIDTVYIHKSLNFEQIEEASKIPREVIQWLNPSYTKNYIPVYDEPVCLFLPKKGVIHFIRAEKYLEEAEEQVVNQEIGSKVGRERIIHVVSKGEFFHKIAIDNHCRISDIMYWNGMKNRNLYIDQKLVIWRPKKEKPFFFIAKDCFREKPVLDTSSFLSNSQNKRPHQ